MKLDLTSLYFNGDTETIGNTAGWGTALGQKTGNDISVDGAKDIISLLENPSHKIIFDPNVNPNHKANIRQLKEKKYPFAGKFNYVIVNSKKIECPFILLVAEDTEKSVETKKHIGRKSLKYNNKIEVDGVSNIKFYETLQKIYGENSCWFAYDISSIKGELHMSTIKVSDYPIKYTDKVQREEHWENFLNNFSNIKDEFKKFLNSKLRTTTTAPKYIDALNKLEAWLIEKKIVSNDYIIWNYFIDTNSINDMLNNEFLKDWKILNQNSNHWYSAPWNNWQEFVTNKIKPSQVHKNNNKKTIMPTFNYKSFHKKTEEAGLLFSEKMVARFVASLCTKPFVICSGLSGSGKTKLAQAFVQWICESEEQYKIIPVGADWTNREPLLGYPNAIETDKYVVPENGVLKLIIDAIENDTKPYFLILDEMNLSHVERYFADFLSAMESGESIPLHSIEDNSLLIPKEIKLPQNLFIIGTVNIDETTYMFSPKVLDRANTIEFRLNEEDLENYFKSKIPLKMETLNKEGVSMATNFVEIATDETQKDFDKIKNDLIGFFKELKKNGAEYGYRTASEIGRLIQKLEYLGEKDDDLLDIAIMQKLLPKLHGSRSKLSKVLITLGSLCLNDANDCENNYFKKIDEIEFINDKNIRYKLSFEKIIRMYKNALDNGFASYAEA